METIYRDGRPVGGFVFVGPQGALGDAPTGGTPALASVMTGATVGLFVYVLHAPLWSAVLGGAAAAVTTKYLIDRA